MKKRDMILSIIIPVYNVEKYVRKCLESIYNQNFPHDEVEIIIVNDGTPDHSMDIISEFVDEYTNITVINQSNQGLSMARNNGMLKSIGQYVWFIDSDDWIQDDAIQTILSCIKKYEMDIISTKLIRIKESDGSKTIDKRNKYIEGKNFISGKDYLFDEGSYAPVQQFIYKRSFLFDNKLTFLPKIRHEDAQFNLRALYLCKELYLLQSPVYNYLLRNTGSIMSSMNVSNAKDLLTIHQSLYLFGESIVSKTDKKKWKALISNMISLIFLWLYHCVNDDDFRKFYKENRRYINRYIWDKLHQKHFHKFILKQCFLIHFFPFYYMKSLSS